MLASSKSGCLEILGKKFKPPEDPSAKEWFSCYFDEGAQAALDDITRAEPAIYITSDGVFVGTRLKRKLCRGGTSIKTFKDLEKLISELEPDKPIQSVAWTGHHPPAVNAYNLMLAGPGWNSSILGALPDTIGYSESASPDDVYALFLQRQNNHLLQLAERMIDQHVTDVNKGEAVSIIYTASMKHAAAARTNSLMKSVFVHESKKKFVKGVREDGDVEMSVIKGDIAGTKFGDFGGIVFELFYRADLDMYVYD